MEIVSGRYSPGSRLPSVRELASRDMQELLDRMKALGYTRQEITELMYQELDAYGGEAAGS